MIRPLAVATVMLALASTALPSVVWAQKGPAAQPASDPFAGVILGEFVEGADNTLTLDGVTARLEAQSNADGTITPVYSLSDGTGELLRFEGEPSFFSFLPAGMRLANIDPSSPEPELIANSYTGGAHCCDRVQVAAITPDGSWQMHELGLFDGGYDMADPNGDGIGEIQVADQSFLYTFDCYACSFPPPRFFSMQGGQPIDISADADLYAAFESELANFDLPASMRDEPGRLAGWAAVEARLGRGDEALAILQEINAASDAIYEVCVDDTPIWECADANKREVGFVEFLRSHLVEQGYLTARRKG